jgi:hypothetical protein
MLGPRCRAPARLLVAAVLGGCSRTASVPADSHTVEVTSAVGPYKHVTLQERFTSGYVHVHGSRPDEVKYTLTMDEGTSQQTIPLETHGGWGDTPPARMELLREGTMALHMAPDGHALALALARGDPFRYVGLDTSGAPLFCQHVTFVASTSGDVWAAAPTTRELALGILAASRSLPSPHLPDPAARIDDEFVAATGYACAHSSEPAMSQALARAVAMQDSPVTVDASVDPLVSCVESLARADAAVRATLEPVVSAQAPSMEHAAMRSARALSTSDDPVVADTVAAALAQPAATRAGAEGGCWLRGTLSWALARVTTTRRAASAASINALVTVARTLDPCPAEALGGMAARVYAVRGLAVLTDPRAGAALRALAAECEAGLPEWPAGFTRFNEGYSRAHDVGCWARVALQQQTSAAPASAAPASAAPSAAKR